MITIDLLKNHPECLPKVAEIWHELFIKIWLPDIGLEKIINYLNKYLNNDSLFSTFVALDGNEVVGMCSLDTKDCIRPDLSPWLIALAVHPKYQGRNIGKQLIDIAKKEVADAGYSKLHLCTFDPNIPEYYKALGWEIIGMDEYAGHPLTVIRIGLL